MGFFCLRDAQWAPRFDSAHGAHEGKLLGHPYSGASCLFACLAPCGRGLLLTGWRFAFVPAESRYRGDSALVFFFFLARDQLLFPRRVSYQVIGFGVTFF